MRKIRVSVEVIDRDAGQHLVHRREYTEFAFRADRREGWIGKETDEAIVTLMDIADEV